MGFNVSIFVNIRDLFNLFLFCFLIDAELFKLSIRKTKIKKILIFGGNI